MVRALAAALIGFLLLPGLASSAVPAHSTGGSGPGWVGLSFDRAGSTTILATLDVQRSGPVGVGIFTFGADNAPTSPFHTLLFDDRNVNGPSLTVSSGLTVRLRKAEGPNGEPIDRVLATFSSSQTFQQKIAFAVGGDGLTAWSFTLEATGDVVLRGTTAGSGAFATTPRDWDGVASERVDEDKEVIVGPTYARTFNRPVTFVWDRFAFGVSPAPMEILGPEGWITCRCVEFGTEHDEVSNAGDYVFHYGSFGHEADTWVVGAEGLTLPG